MATGFTKEFICRFVWNELTKLAKNRVTCSYEDIANAIHREFDTFHYGPRNINYLLGPIQEYCMHNNLPPLTSLVVNKQKGIPGNGFVAADVFNKKDLRNVTDIIYEYNWKLIKNPFAGFDSETSSVSDFADEILKNPPKAKDVYRKVCDRGMAQKIFKEVVLKAYDSKCAICNNSFYDTLNAAHIKPWSIASDEERIDPRNGILLCPCHHALFDSSEKWMEISEDYEIIFDEDYIETDGDKAILGRFKGKKLRLPKDKNLWPNPELLKKRRKGKFD